MIIVTCDHCKKSVIDPQERFNVFEVWRNDTIYVDRSYKNKHHLCKFCYEEYCKLIDSFNTSINTVTETLELERTVARNKFNNFE